MRALFELYLNGFIFILGFTSGLTQDYRCDKITVTSPNYPMEYGSNVDHGEYLTVHSFQRVLIHFDMFNIEDHHSASSQEFNSDGHIFMTPTHCGYDWLVLLEYCTGTTHVLFEDCGTQTFSQSIISNCPEVRLHFHTDTYVRLRGYVLRYEGFPRSDCMLQEMRFRQGQLASQQISAEPMETINTRGAFQCARLCMTGGMSYLYNKTTEECKIFRNDEGVFDLEQIGYN